MQTVNEYTLVFLNTPRAGEAVPLPQGELFIGRSRSNAIVLEDPLVSRKHVRIAVTADRTVAEDLDSSHGTFLNDKRIRGSVSLNDGDVLQLGDVKLKFTPPAKPEPEECTAFVDGAEAPAPQASGATGFAQVPSGGETRFVPPPKLPAEDDLDKTRVIGDGETRLMDENELKGLRAAPRQPLPRGKLLPVAVLLATIAIISGVWILTREDDACGGGTTAVTSHTNDQHSLVLAAPAGWKLTQGSKGAVFGFESAIRGSETPARMDVYADRNQDYGITGLQTSFEAYTDAIAARYPGMRLQRQVMQVNRATCVFYAFTSAARSGKGIFLLSGNKRICVECSCPTSCTNLLRNVFPPMLRTFRLTEKQQFIDFPPPTEAVRRIALANREHLAQMSKRDLDAGIALLKERDVRPENLHLAQRTLQGCMTTASALGERPPFYAEAAAKLAEATHHLEKGLLDQKVRLIVAEKKRDIEQAYWEALKLAQMMPEKTNSEYYQYATKRIEFYTKLRTQQ